MIFVVGFGCDREGDEELNLAIQTIDAKREQHNGNLIVAFVGCERSIGLKLKQYCLEREKGEPPRICLVEFAVRLWGSLQRSEMAKGWLARNGAVVEFGDEFLVFLGRERQRSLVSDLLARIRLSGKPLQLVE